MSTGLLHNPDTGESFVACPNCEGAGEIATAPKGRIPEPADYWPCPECQGSGAETDDEGWERRDH